ncbi:MAG: AroM family protein [Bacteroidetes bacterium]|nr:AroM family protein [Bacteroidota bacterium]
MPVSIALHTIGQTPRPDLTPFIAAAIGVPDIVVTGALDGLAAADVPAPAPGDFPLETRLSDGTRVEVGASFLAPLLQQRIDAMEERVELHLVLCAGPLPDLTAQGALVRPFEHACDVLLSRGVRRPLVIVPFDTQAAPARGKWVQSGFDPEVRSMEERPPDQPADVWLLDIGHAAVADGADALILDYVGYRKQILDAVQRGLPVPVIDLGHLATDFVRELLDEMSGLAPEA